MMSAITLGDIAVATNAEILGGDKNSREPNIESIKVTGVGIDSRKIQPGDLFVALAGEHVDGHNYLVQAGDSGAVAALVEREVSVELPQLRVKDSGIALAAIAKHNRKCFSGSVVAITGSAGKTTCKNMIAALLAARYKVCATVGNQNNELGVPLTVCRIADEHEVAVIEMGAAQKGDIKYLTDIALPAISVLTNVNEAHVGRFGNLLTTAQTKGEIFAALPDGGVAVLNADDEYADLWREEIALQGRDIRIAEFSLRNDSAAVCVDEIECDETGTSFRVTLNFGQRKESFVAKSRLLGKHNVANAAAAIAVAVELNIETQAICDGLGALAAEPGRLMLHPAKNNLVLIDDSYNASPQAVIAAAEVLGSVASKRNARSVMALGDMAELGENAAKIHEEVGSMVSQQGVDSLFVTGNYAPDYLRGFRHGLGDAAQLKDGSSVQEFSSKQDMAARLMRPEYSGTVVLVKGSRSSAMDELVELLSVQQASSLSGVSGEVVHAHLAG